MSFESSNVGATSNQSATNSVNNTNETTERQSLNYTLNSVETKRVIDEATGILQTIVKDKISDEVIRKIPNDEYLKLLALLDRMIAGSINDEV